MGVKEDIEEYFKDVVFVVEANNFESHALWTMWHYKPAFRTGAVKKWDQESRGYGITIGYYHKRPVVVSIGYAKIEGRRVAFYYSCSQLVDHAMVDKWIRARTKHIKWDNGYRWAHTDSMNFGHCLGHIDELNKVA